MKLPPLPPGFEIEESPVAPQQPAMSIPPLPPGFEIEQDPMQLASARIQQRRAEVGDLSEGEQTAIIDAYRMMAGQDPMLAGRDFHQETLEAGRENAGFIDNAGRNFASTLLGYGTGTLAAGARQVDALAGTDLLSGVEEGAAETEMLLNPGGGVSGFAGSLAGNAAAIVPGIVSGGSSLLARLGLPAIFGVSTAGQAFMDTERRRDEGQDIGAGAEYANAVVQGTLEATMERFGLKIAGDLAQAFAKNAPLIREAWQNGGEEGLRKALETMAGRIGGAMAGGALEEGATQVGQNLTQQTFIDPEQGLLEGVGQAALAGALLPVVTMPAGILRRRQDNTDPDAPVEPQQPDPNGPDGSPMTPRADKLTDDQLRQAWNDVIRTGAQPPLPDISAGLLAEAQRRGINLREEFRSRPPEVPTERPQEPSVEVGTPDSTTPAPETAPSRVQPPPQPDVELDETAVVFNKGRKADAEAYAAALRRESGVTRVDVRPMLGQPDGPYTVEVTMPRHTKEERNNRRIINRSVLPGIRKQAMRQPEYVRRSVPMSGIVLEQGPERIESSYQGPRPQDDTGPRVGTGVKKVPGRKQYAKEVDAGSMGQYIASISGTVDQSNPEDIAAEAEYHQGVLQNLRHGGDKFVQVEMPLEAFETINTPDAGVVQGYAGKPGTTAPPIVAGTMEEGGKLVITDGKHRLEAARRRGDKTITAYVPESDAQPAAPVVPGSLLDRKQRSEQAAKQYAAKLPPVQTPGVTRTIEDANGTSVQVTFQGNDGSVLRSIFGNRDMPGRSDDPKAGELFQIAVKNQRKGTGTSLVKDMLASMRAAGLESVIIRNPNEKAGQPFRDSLIRNGLISEAIETAESGTSKHAILYPAVPSNTEDGTLDVRTDDALDDVSEATQSQIEEAGDDIDADTPPPSKPTPPSQPRPQPVKVTPGERSRVYHIVVRRPSDLQLEAFTVVARDATTAERKLKRHLQDPAPWIVRLDDEGPNFPGRKLGGTVLQRKLSRNQPSPPKAKPAPKAKAAPKPEPAQGPVTVTGADMQAASGEHLFLDPKAGKKEFARLSKAREAQGLPPAELLEKDGLVFIRVDEPNQDMPGRHQPTDVEPVQEMPEPDMPALVGMSAPGIMDPIKSWFRRNMTSKGDLPADVFDEKIARDGQIKSRFRQIDLTVAEYRRIAKRHYGTSTLDATTAAGLNRYLQGGPAPANAPQDMLALLDRMRSEVDGLSLDLMNSGAIQGKMKAVVQNNLGVYLNRSYRVFDDKNWHKKVPPQVVNRAAAFIRAELTPPSRAAMLQMKHGQLWRLAFRHGLVQRGQRPTKGALIQMLGNVQVTDGQVNGVINSLLSPEADSPLSYIGSKKLGSKNLNILVRRKGIPAEIRALWGERTDPLQNYALTVGKLSSLVANHKFLDSVKRAGAGRFLFDNPVVKDGVSYHVKLAGDQTKTMHPLNGMYTTPELAKAWQESDNTGNLPNWFSLYMRVNGAVKVSKTVLSMMSQIRNMIGSSGFAVAQGHWRAGNAKSAGQTALAELANRDKNGFVQEYRRLQELGVVHESVRAGELQDLMKDATRGDLSPFDPALSNKLAGKVYRGAVVAYRLGDDFWKMYGFYNEVARYQKAHPNWTKAQVEKRAAEIIRSTYPTYSLVPKSIRWMRQFPVLGTFVSFPAEVFRTGYNTLDLIAAELKSPETRGIGMQRLAGASIAATGTSAIAVAARYLSGVSEEEDEELRRFMPPWNENSQIAYISSLENGVAGFIDLSYVDPHEYLKRPIIAFMRGEDWQAALLSSMAEAASPFFSEEILAQHALDVARNQKKNGGRVYNPQATAWQKFDDVWKHLAEPLKPGTYTSLERLYKGMTGYVSPFGRKYDPEVEALALFTGTRAQEVDVRQSFRFKASRYNNERSESASIVLQVLNRRGTVTDREIVNAGEETENARRRLFDSLVEDAQAAIKLGVPSPEVYQSMVDAGIPKAEAARVMANQYVPYTPQDPRVAWKLSQARNRVR